MPVAEIADRLGRASSTIYRELRRNTFTDQELPELNGYYALSAQSMCEKRRAVHRKMVTHPELKAAIKDRLKAGWSPEQIAGRMKLERHPIRVNHALPDRVLRSNVPKGKRSIASPTPRMAAKNSFTGICQSIAGIAGNVACGATDARTSSTIKACQIGLTGLLSVMNLVIHCPIGDCRAICR